MEQTDLINALETVLFAAAEPVTLADLRKIFTRLWGLDVPAKITGPKFKAKTPPPAPKPEPVAAPEADLVSAPEAEAEPDLVAAPEAEPESAPQLELSLEVAAAADPEVPAAAEEVEGSEAPEAAVEAKAEPEAEAEAAPEEAPSAPEEPESEVNSELKLRLQGLTQAVAALKERWAHSERGFVLLEVAEGLVFRTNPRYSDVVRAMREEKPQRLSKPALETLAIVAYRQPVTKPEVDTIRGVDCGGTFKVLVDRNLLRIVGKKEEVGRPLLYGTTKDFLSLFNLASLTELPSLREFHELNDDSQEQVQALDGGALPSLQELSASAKQLRLDDEAATGDLDDAVKMLNTTEVSTRDALAAEGIVLPGDEEAAAPTAPAPSPAAAETLQ